MLRIITGTGSDVEAVERKADRIFIATDHITLGNGNPFITFDAPVRLPRRPIAFDLPAMVKSIYIESRHVRHDDSEGAYGPFEVLVHPCSEWKADFLVDEHGIWAHGTEKVMYSLESRGNPPDRTVPSFAVRHARAIADLYARLNGLCHRCLRIGVIVQATHECLPCHHVVFCEACAEHERTTTTTCALCLTSSLGWFPVHQ